MFFASLGGVQILSPRMLCKEELTFPQRGMGSVAWGHGHPQSCFHLASCHQPWSPLGESAHLAPQELSTGELGALSSHADLCPEDRSLCVWGWLFPAPPESMVFVPRLPASPGWEPGHPAPGVEKGRK